MQPQPCLRTEEPREINMAMILAKDEEKWQSGKSILLPVHWVLAQRKGSWVMGERPVYIYHGIR